MNVRRYSHPRTDSADAKCSSYNSVQIPLRYVASTWTMEYWMIVMQIARNETRPIERKYFQCLLCYSPATYKKSSVAKMGYQPITADPINNLNDSGDFQACTVLSSSCFNKKQRAISHNQINQARSIIPVSAPQFILPYRLELKQSLQPQNLQSYCPLNYLV